MSNESYTIIMLLALIVIAVIIMFNQAMKIGYYEQKLRNRAGWFTENDWKKIQRMMDTHFPIFKKW